MGIAVSTIEPDNIPNHGKTVIHDINNPGVIVIHDSNMMCDIIQSGLTM